MLPPGSSIPNPSPTLVPVMILPPQAAVLSRDIGDS
jgi:hypothetical protein